MKEIKEACKLLHKPINIKVKVFKGFELHLIQIFFSRSWNEWDKFPIQFVQFLLFHSIFNTNSFNYSHRIVSFLFIRLLLFSSFIHKRRYCKRIGRKWWMCVISQYQFMIKLRRMKNEEWNKNRRKFNQM